MLVAYYGDDVYKVRGAPNALAPKLVIERS
jgi:hypothetical protein